MLDSVNLTHRFFNSWRLYVDFWISTLHRLSVIILLEFSFLKYVFAIIQAVFIYFFTLFNDVKVSITVLFCYAGSVS